MTGVCNLIRPRTPPGAGSTVGTASLTPPSVAGRCLSQVTGLPAAEGSFLSSGASGSLRVATDTAHGDGGMTQSCACEGCDLPSRSRGWCVKHYTRWLRHGDLEVHRVVKSRPELSPEQLAEQLANRLLQNRRMAAFGCWEWPRATIEGYGVVWASVEGPDGRTFKNVRVHRAAWELWRGPIPEGLKIDHLCRNRRCFNPDHLEPVTDRVNILRGVSPSAINARKTHCIRGHELVDGNIRWGIKAGVRFRQCAICLRARGK